MGEGEGFVTLVQAAVFEIKCDAVLVQLGNLLRTSQQAIVRPGVCGISLGSCL